MTAILSDLPRAAHQRAAFVIRIHANTDAVTDCADPVWRCLRGSYEAERNKRTDCELIPFRPHAYASPRVGCLQENYFNSLTTQTSDDKKGPKSEQFVSMWDLCF
jgi:hypothetical protein